MLIISAITILIYDSITHFETDIEQNTKYKVVGLKIIIIIPSTQGQDTWCLRSGCDLTDFARFSENITTKKPHNVESL